LKHRFRRPFRSHAFLQDLLGQAPAPQRFSSHPTSCTPFATPEFLHPEWGLCFPGP
jgi:hypothetical protein